MTAFSSDFLFHFPSIFSLWAIFSSLSLDPCLVYCMPSCLFLCLCPRTHLFSAVRRSGCHSEATFHSLTASVWLPLTLCAVLSRGWRSAPRHFHCPILAATLSWHSRLAVCHKSWAGEPSLLFFCFNFRQFSHCVIFFLALSWPLMSFLLHASAIFLVSVQENTFFELFVSLNANQRPLSILWQPLCECLFMCVLRSVVAALQPPVTLTALFWQKLFPYTLGLLCVTNPGQVSLLSCFSVSISVNFLTVCIIFLALSWPLVPFLLHASAIFFVSIHECTYFQLFITLVGLERPFFIQSVSLCDSVCMCVCSAAWGLVRVVLILIMIVFFLTFCFTL